MAAKRKRGTTAKSTLWSILNSPLVLLIISGVVLAGAAKLYADHQEAAKDQAIRRAAFGRLLTEYQHRIAGLSSADAELDYMLGDGSNFDFSHKLDQRDKAAVAKWERVSSAVSQREWDILAGGGAYAPAIPEYKGVHLYVLAADMEAAAGFPDYHYGALRMLGFLNQDAGGNWVFVRALLPQMQSFGVSRSLLYTSGEIPLIRGKSLTARQERILGIPNPTDEELAALQKQNDELVERLKAIPPDPEERD